MPKRIEAGLQRLLSRIGLGWRLAISIAVLIAPLGVLGFWYVQSKVEAIELARAEKAGFGYVEPLEHLVRHMVDRRGFVALHGTGDGDALGKIRQVTLEIDRDIARLEAHGGFGGDLREAREQFDAVKSGAARLKGELQAGPAEKSYLRDTALLRQIVDLGRIVAEQMLIMDPRPETSYLIDTFFIHGFDRTQTIAGIRDKLVIATAGGGPASEAHRLEIAAAVVRIRELDGVVEREIARAYRLDPDLEGRIGPALVAARAKLEPLIGYADGVVRGEPLALSAAERFAVGTEVLDQYDELDEIADRIFTEKIDRIIAEVTRQELTAIALVLIMILIGLATAILSLRSVTGPVGRLTRTIDLLAQGHKDTRSGLDTADEIGVLGREFDRLMDERRSSEEKLAYLAQFDALTGLPNRHMLHDRLKQTLALNRGGDAHTGCMFVDLDRFKQVNDTFGHSVGDKLLIQVAERLRKCVRGGDTVGRLGGDEFAVVLAGLASADNAALVAKKIVAAFAVPFDLDGQETYASASIGIALFPDDAKEADDLLKNADTAMYRAKEQGRNNYQFYLAEMNQRALQRLQLETSLRGAAERAEFVLHYQPKVELTGCSISGFEALLRWQHPGRGLVSPLEFIPVLEETGQIVAVGEWVLEAACAQVKAWQAQGLGAQPVAINVSARQFQQRHLDGFMARIRNAAIDPALIHLELTESLLMQDAASTIRALASLKDCGVRLSIDDFGTGYSSLAYLKRFPLDELKIDRAFVRDIITDPEDAEITLAIISLAHSLDLKVVAEGVETEAQLLFLRSHGCDEIQGYYFARPAPAGECSQMLREGRRLRLPAADSASGQAPAVLVVDDNPADIELLRRALTPSGYRLFEAAGPQAAFDVLTRHPVDLVISDHSMPGMSGVDFLARVRKLYPGAVRIVTSGHGSAETVTDAVNEAGIHKFLSKDWTAERLRAEVREAFQRAAQRAKSAAERA